MHDFRRDCPFPPRLDIPIHSFEETIFVDARWGINAYAKGYHDPFLAAYGVLGERYWDDMIVQLSYSLCTFVRDRRCKEI